MVTGELVISTMECLPVSPISTLTGIQCFTGAGGCQTGIERNKAG